MLPEKASPSISQDKRKSAYIQKKLGGIKKYFSRPKYNRSELNAKPFAKPWLAFLIEAGSVFVLFVFLTLLVHKKIEVFSNANLLVLRGSPWLEVAVELCVILLAFFYSYHKKHWLEPVEIVVPIFYVFLFDNFLLYPQSNGNSYASGIILFPILSFLFPVFRVLFKSVPPDSSQANGYLIPDYDLGYLSELASKHEKKSAAEIDKESNVGFNAYASEIARAANLIRPNRAFSIGIDGEWGSGKTSLMALIRENLETTKPAERDIVVMNFKPWMFDNKQSLLENFFAVWAKQFSGNMDLRNDLQQYVKILNKAEGQLFKTDLTELLLGMDRDTNAIKERLESVILSSGKVYNFFIDDLDRVEQSEVLEVIRLCKILADFPNTIYFIAYDRAYINGALKHFTTDEEKQAEYFDKIVQLEFKVPVLVESKLKEILFKCLDDQINLLEIENRPGPDIVRNAINPKYVPYLLKNIRGVKRFANIFLLRYKLANTSVDFTLFFRFELLHFSLRGIYHGLYESREDLLKLITGGGLNFREFTNRFDCKFTQYEGEMFELLLSDLLLSNKTPSVFFNNFYGYFILAGFETYVSQAEFEAFTKNLDEKILLWWLNNDAIASILEHIPKNIHQYSSNSSPLVSTDEIKSDGILIQKILSALWRSNLRIAGLAEARAFELIGMVYMKVKNGQLSSVVFDKLMEIVSEDNDAKFLINSMMGLGYNFEPFPIKSDMYTIYHGCDKKELFGNKIDNKVGLSAILNHPAWADTDFPELEGCFWISRAETLFPFECDDFGPTFTFKRVFFLFCQPSSLVKAELKIIVDDDCEILCNSESLPACHGYASPTSIDLLGSLRQGLNELTFLVKNANISANRKWTSTRELQRVKEGRRQFDHNPYGLRYKLSLKLFSKDTIALPERSRYLEDL